MFTRLSGISDLPNYIQSARRIIGRQAGILNICRYHHKRRGGFITRPRSGIEPFSDSGAGSPNQTCRYGQGGFVTRPYNSTEPVRVKEYPKCW